MPLSNIDLHYIHEEGKGPNAMPLLLSHGWPGSVFEFYKLIPVPTGYVEFLKEILRPPRSAAERMFKDIRRWTVAQKGGHFAASEHPDFLANEIREFFSPLRKEPSDGGSALSIEAEHHSPPLFGIYPPPKV